MSEMFPEKWDLDSLLPRPETPAFRQEIQSLAKGLEDLANEAEQLPQPASDPEIAAVWKQFLVGYERWESKFVDLRSHLDCHLAVDASNKNLIAIDGQLSALTPWRERISTSLEIALQIAPPADLEDLCRAESAVGELRYFLETRRKSALLRLPKEQEMLSAELAVDGLHAWGRLYDLLTGSLRIQLMERGKLVEKSPGQVTFDSPQRAIREGNFFAADAAWARIAEPCASALNHLAGTRLTICKRLGRSHLDAPLNLNRMRRETLETMWQTITARKSELLPYLQTKAKLLGVERMAWWDQFAPLPTPPGRLSDDELDYPTACQQVILAFQRFSGDLGDFAQMSFKNRWIEAENRGGKKQGAFCTSFPGPKQSRVFMTYVNTTDNMFTLAHELGHAYHSWVLRDKPVFLSDYPMNLAETASTFAEAVLADDRLSRAETPFAKLSILDAMLGDSVAFLMNIHARFLFEDQFYKQRRQSELTVDQLNALMVSAQKEAYLNSFSDDGWNPHFWVSKLHFYITQWPFYNFPYTFGYLLSMGIFAMGKEGETQFSHRYRQFLELTGSMDAEDCVRASFDADLTQAPFWNRSLDIVANRVRQFTEIAKDVLS